MKLSKLAALCKRSGYIHLYQEGDSYQWISNGYAAYIAYNLTPQTKESIFEIFGIIGKKKDEISYEKKPFPEHISFADTDDGEAQLDPPGLELMVEGTILRPYRTSQGITLIDTQYLSPLEQTDSLEMFERTDTQGDPYIVAKSGMDIQAVILPRRPLMEGHVQELQDLAELSAIALETQEAKTTGMVRDCVLFDGAGDCHDCKDYDETAEECQRTEEDGHEES